MSVAEICSLIALLACLAAALVRPRGLPEVVTALPLVAVLLVTGIEPWRAAGASVRTLAPTLVFLALILAFGQLCADAGVFDYLGALAARASAGRSTRLLVVVVFLASVITAVLTLDATVILLTPVVLRSARALDLPSRPHAYACVELANAGSLLLPISNLTNLLAFTASGLSFGRFAALMALPWVITTVLEWLGLRAFFHRDLPGGVRVAPALPPTPVYGLIVVSGTVLGFGLTSALHVAPAWAAGAGAALLAVPLMRAGRSRPREVLSAASLGFIGFVFALGVVVDALDRHGLAHGLADLLPGGSSLPALLAVAFVAAVAANLVNNLPATLALVPVVAGHPIAVLAMLLGVNIGPNATYVGSLANLLWRRLLPDGERARARDFHRYGLMSVPVVLVAATSALWLVS